MKKEKFIYWDKIERNKIIITSYEQLSELSGLTAQTISKHLKRSNVYCDSEGRFEIERVPVVIDKSKVRNSLKK